MSYLTDGLIYNQKGLNKELDCGDCNMCCKLPNINKTYFKDTIFQKDSFEWCKNCEIGVGCKVYKDRPKTCKDYECTFLCGFTYIRPNKLGFLVTLEDINGISPLEAKVITIFCEQHKLSNLIKNINKEHNLRYLINQGFKFVIRTNKDNKDLWVYDPKISDELIKPSQKQVEDAREFSNA